MVSAAWQTVLVDLSLILFIVAASGLQPEKALGTFAEVPVATSQALIGVWRDSNGGPSLRQWLDSQVIDPRQQLTVQIGYSPGQLEPAMARAAALIEDIPIAARIIIEPAEQADVSARLGFDQSAPAVPLNALKGQ